ncbi:MAG: DegV family protein [Anaerolineae bacterium]|jgi:DegV family protein with EDD domain
MKRVVVVTDSNATLPQHLVQELDIRVVPILLHLNGRAYRDGVDLTPAEFYQLLRSNEHVPTTSAPSVGDFLRVYAAAVQDASGVVTIHLPPKLSAVYNTALLASQLVDGAPIRVVDSRSVAMAQGFVVLEAARAAAAGADMEEVIARAEEVAAKVQFFAALETLEYLHRGGRIGSAAALMGSALQIRPILYLDDGQVQSFARPRTRRQAIRRMLQLMAEGVAGRRVHVAVMHAGASEEAEKLRQQVAARFDCIELYLTEFTPVMGAHAGPGLLGIAFYVD